MARVKGGFRPHLRHKKVLKLAKGKRGAYHRLFKRANEGMLHALWYAYRHRRQRRRDLRRRTPARTSAQFTEMQPVKSKKIARRVRRLAPYMKLYKANPPG